MEDFYFPYVLPQETGNHEDTRWAAFVTEAGMESVSHRIKILFEHYIIHRKPDTGDTYK